MLFPNFKKHLIGLRRKFSKLTFRGKENFDDIKKANQI